MTGASKCTNYSETYASRIGGKATTGIMRLSQANRLLGFKQR
jgi:hypothetical protein